MSDAAEAVKRKDVSSDYESGLTERITSIPFRLDPDAIDKATKIYEDGKFTIFYVEEAAKSKISVQVYAGPDLDSWPPALDDALSEAFDADVEFQDNDDEVATSAQCTYVVVPMPAMMSVEDYMKPRVEKLKELLGLE